MHRTTIYLPDELKARLAEVARRERRSEAEIIRQSLTVALAKRARPRPRVSLHAPGLGDASAAQRVDELLDGFGVS